MGIIWRKSVDTAQKSVLTLEDLPSLKMMRLKRAKLQLPKLLEILQTFVVGSTNLPPPPTIQTSVKFRDFAGAAVYRYLR